MTSKENLISTIKEARPKAKDSTVNMYVANLVKLKKIYDSDNLKFLDKPKEVLEKIDHLHFTTQRNYLNAVVVYLMALSKDPEEDDIIKEYVELRDTRNQIYEDNQATGLISDKQKDAFVDISVINDMIADMAKEIKEKKIRKKEDLTPKDKALLQTYVLFSIYTRLPLRNDLAGMEAISKRTYNKLTEDDKKVKNYLVVNKGSMNMILNQFKTSSKYGELKIDIPKDLEKLLRLYIRINGLGILFKSSTGKELSRNALTQLLLKTTKARIGKAISTTMLRKIYLSSKYAEVKDEMSQDAAVMGHSIDVQSKVYIKKSQED
tara:strand:+ start:292 stop:1254 length:963 start_codon:yes stop_codon:yes gene_type:complete